MPQISRLYYNDSSIDFISQGDIFKDVTITNIKGNWGVITTTFPYIIVMTQQCDLMSDFAERNNSARSNDWAHLLNILCCPAYPLDSFQRWDHILNIRRKPFNQGEINKVIGNNEARYFFLPKSQKSWITSAIILDFKLFVTIDRNELYGLKTNNYISSIEELFREQVMQKFSHYISRIWVPELTWAKDI